MCPWRNAGPTPRVEMAKLTKKAGRLASPVVLAGRTIAGTFWGKAWCDNLEAYSDYANRLPRGRTYIRNGSVVDLQISEGKIASYVSGSELYEIEIKIKPLPHRLWKTIQTECAGKIDSLIELLQGKLSSAVMQVVTRQQTGLFPSPKEIDLDCSCPDWAGLCKHVAATLYGVGARLDEKPELLFLLRGVDPSDSSAAPQRPTSCAQLPPENPPPPLPKANWPASSELNWIPRPPPKRPQLKPRPPTKPAAPKPGPPLPSNVPVGGNPGSSLDPRFPENL